ncbi:MAG: energy transducer TonB [Janthinobacterium lividum]
MRYGSTLIRAAAFCALSLPTGCAAAPAPAAHTDIVALAAPHPIYPPELQAIGAEGTVAISCTVNTAGSTEACVVASSTDHRFDAAALAATRGARYRPATEDGIPIRETHHSFHINFKLGRQPTPKVTSRFDCAVDPQGHTVGCTVLDGRHTQEELLAMTGFIHSLSVAPRVLDGHPVEDPHRVIEVWMIVTPVVAAQLALMLPPADLEVNYLLSCRTHETADLTHCARIGAGALQARTEPAFGEDETEQPTILRISLGLSGYLPATL